MAREGVPEVDDDHPKDDAGRYLDQQLLGPKWDEDAATPVPLLLLNIHGRYGCGLPYGSAVGSLRTLAGREWHGRSLRIVVPVSKRMVASGVEVRRSMTREIYHRGLEGLNPVTPGFGSNPSGQWVNRLVARLSRILTKRTPSLSGYGAK